MAPIFKARDKLFPLTRTYVMGILNVTPDSFSDGGRYTNIPAALRRAAEMAAEGADIIDIGGQSTRPGFAAVSPEEEWERVSRVIPAVIAETGLAVSVDTFYPEVAEKALQAGAHIINDVSGFGDEMLKTAAGSGCGCVITHPGSRAGGNAPEGVNAFFRKRLEAAESLGVSRERLCFDPGIGFGKEYEDDLALISRIGEAKIPGCACLIGASRKRVIGRMTGEEDPEKRTAGTIAAHTAGILGGADIIRVHDVKEAVQAARAADAIKERLNG